MKKLKTHYLILIVCASYFLLNGCIPRNEEIIPPKASNTHEFWQLYAIDLQSEGYTKEASEKIAKTDYNIIPMDAEYEGLIND